MDLLGETPDEQFASGVRCGKIFTLTWVEQMAEKWEAEAKSLKTKWYSPRAFTAACELEQCAIELRERIAEWRDLPPPTNTY